MPDRMTIESDPWMAETEAAWAAAPYAAIGVSMAAMTRRPDEAYALAALSPAAATRLAEENAAEGIETAERMATLWGRERAADAFDELSAQFTAEGRDDLAAYYAGRARAWRADPASQIANMKRSFDEAEVVTRADHARRLRTLYAA